MVNEYKCVICGKVMDQKYLPMKEWKINGVMCGKCYSKKISEHYPGKHVRVNLPDSNKV
ncbi:MAG: hypothetical protein AABX15_02690 [Thermoproteota archaeon]|jgi:DNA-directed RNA polymerase subunit RPC12/RpoP|nr:hypothetical protein [Nitrosopumilaceae archaeon]